VYHVLEATIAYATLICTFYDDDDDDDDDMDECKPKSLVLAVCLSVKRHFNDSEFDVCRRSSKFGEC